jgi:3-oxoacyl-[acyl-carrier protein] reductase
MDLGIKGKTALVLGGGGGLGAATAKALAREGARLALGDLNKEAAERSAEAVRQEGGCAISLDWNLAELGEIEQQVSCIEKKLGPIEILINNTGGPPPTPSTGQDATLWSENFQSMVLSVIKLTDRVLPAMRDQKWGRIITSTSSGVVAPISNLGISNALRLSLVGWSKTLAGEVGRHGITANVVVPGRIATRRIIFLDEQKAKREGRPVTEISAQSVASIPIGRYGNPEEYGDVIAFLASNRAAYITGSVVRVDGGFIPSI